MRFVKKGIVNEQFIEKKRVQDNGKGTRKKRKET